MFFCRIIIFSFSYNFIHTIKYIGCPINTKTSEGKNLKFVVNQKDDESEL